MAAFPGDLVDGLTGFQAKQIISDPRAIFMILVGREVTCSSSIRPGLNFEY